MWFPMITPVLPKTQYQGKKVRQENPKDSSLHAPV